MKAFHKQPEPINRTIIRELPRKLIESKLFGNYKYTGRNDGLNPSATDPNTSGKGRPIHDAKASWFSCWLPTAPILSFA